MKVDLPTPGTPLMPTRCALPVCGSSSASSCCACSRWSGRVDSTSVIARATAARSPSRTVAASCSMEGGTQFLQQLESCFRYHRAGRVDRRGAGLAQRIEVLRRDDAADDDHDVRPALLGEFV